MADWVIAAGRIADGDRLVLEYDEVTGDVLAIRVDDPNGIMPWLTLEKTGLTLEWVGANRYVLPVNQRFNVNLTGGKPTRIDIPRVKFGRRRRAT